MATTRKRTTNSSSKRSTSSRKSDDLMSRTGRTIRERPYVSAAIATGAVTAVAAAAAGAFFFSRRDVAEGDSDDSFTSRVKDGFADAASKAKDMASQWMGSDTTDQSDIAEEALTLKETGKRARHPADPVVEQQTKAGAVAY